MQQSYKHGSEDLVGHNPSTGAGGICELHILPTWVRLGLDQVFVVITTHKLRCDVIKAED